MSEIDEYDWDSHPSRHRRAQGRAVTRPAGCRCQWSPPDKPVCRNPDYAYGICANCYHDKECHERRKPRQEEIWT